MAESRKGDGRRGGETLLVIGRFQPFHKGHERLLKSLSSGGKNRLKIAVGSSNESGTDKNPYTYSKRKEMLRTLESSGVRNFAVFPVADLSDDRAWLLSLIKKSGSFDRAVSGNLLVRRLFRGAGLEAVRNRFFSRAIYSGTAIRKLMKRGLPSWGRRVPKGVRKLIA